MYDVAVRRSVRRSPTPVFEYLLEFPRYGPYARYISAVSRLSDGAGAAPSGRRYEVRAGWQGIEGTVTTVVTAVEPPKRIAWRLADAEAATGAWTLDATAPPAGGEPATNIELSIRFDSAAVEGVADSLPRLIPVEALLGRLESTIAAEAGRVLDRIVADLEAGPHDDEDP